jgi:hypothetical protein
MSDLDRLFTEGRGAAEKRLLDAPMPPLKVTCTSTDCERNLHCFLRKRGMPVEELGACRECGVKVVNWMRLHRRDAADYKFTFEALKQELIRYHMWNIPFDKEALGKAAKQGRSKVLEGIRPRLVSSIGKKQGGFDGRQTPMQGRIIFYGQHATATCCRKCLAYWHDIPPDRPLTTEELDYCERLVAKYIDERLPSLKDGVVT